MIMISGTLSSYSVYTPANLYARIRPTMLRAVWIVLRGSVQVLCILSVIMPVSALTINADQNRQMVQTYGRINVSWQSNAFESTNIYHPTLNSNASRLGVRGAVPLADSLNVVYQLAYGASSRGASDLSVTQRNTYIGVHNDWGLLLFGRLDTPLKMVAAGVDRFNNLDRADIRYSMIGQDRKPHTFMYRSPVFHHTLFTASVITNEFHNNHDITDHYALSVAFNHQAWYAAAAYNYAINHSDTLRLVTEYRRSRWRIGLLYQQAKQHDKKAAIREIEYPALAINRAFKQQTAWLLSGQYWLGQWSLQAQWVRSNSTALCPTHGPDVRNNQLVLGFNYQVSQNIQWITYVSSIEASSSEKTVVDKTLGLGLEVHF